MKPRMRSFRTLDKDLGRISNAEYANVQSWQPLLRFGTATLLCALAALAMTGVFGAGQWGLAVAGGGISAYLAMVIGRSNVAGSLGPAVGAGAIGLIAGLLAVGVMQIAGAGIAGAEVTSRLTSGIVQAGPQASAAASANALARVMVAALLGAGIWISLTAWAGTPISVTQSIVGAILGAGVGCLGWSSVQWASLVTVVLGWVISPLVAAALAAALLAWIRGQLQDRKDPLRVTKIGLPSLIGLMIGLLALHFLGMGLRIGWPLAILAAIFCAGAGGLLGRIVIQRQIARHAKPRAALKAVFNLPLTVSALLMGFAHGANDAPNVIAPLGAILRAGGGAGHPLAGWIAVLAGGGLAVGAMLFGRRLVHMIGGRITRLNASRAFCVSLATAITVLAASGLGLPVATAQVAVGGVFGVGLYRDRLDRNAARPRPELPPEENARRHQLRKSHLRTVFGSWLITAPAAALLAAGAGLIIG